MKFLLEDLIKIKENEAIMGKRASLPSVADSYRKAYYSRKKLTIHEKWNMFWRDSCYPLKRI